MIAASLATFLARASAPFRPDVLWRVPTLQRKLYLTFDDGPTRKGTPALLDLLDKYNAQATFFLIGQAAQTYPELVHAISSAGHTIGNHTQHHVDAWRAAAHVVKTDLMQGHQTLSDLIDKPVQWVRPPYGHLSSTFKTWCRAYQQVPVMWDVLTGDFWPTPSVSKRLHSVARRIRPGSILVLHDNARFHTTSLSLTAHLLQMFKAEGWQFEALAPLDSGPFLPHV